VRGFVVVLAGFEFKAGRWGNAQVDVFREPLNQPKPFGQGLAWVWSCLCWQRGQQGSDLLAGALGAVLACGGL
jgi:hypothetical protein